MSGLIIHVPQWATCLHHTFNAPVDAMWHRTLCSIDAWRTCPLSCLAKEAGNSAASFAACSLWPCLETLDTR
jgi:hypothetical protein